MKHTLRHLVVLLASLFGLTFVYRKFISRRRPLVRVICFHDITDKEWFKNAIDIFVSEFHVLTPEDFHAQKFSEKKINLLVTFDDGYHSWIETALPILEDRGVKALFFVSSGLLDAASDNKAVEEFMRTNLLITPRAALSWEELKLLSSCGHSIGGHTVNHKSLGSLSLSEASNEISRDKIAIELQLGKSITDFAYPFGREPDFNDDITRLAYDTNYQFIYSAIPGFYTETNDRVVPRTLLESNLDVGGLRRYLKGSFDIFTWLKS